MMHTDPPRHTRYRRARPARLQAAARAGPRGVRGRAAKARALVDAIEPGAAGRHRAELSVPFPLQVICELLGVDGDEWPTFYEWSEAVIPGATELAAEERRRLQVEMWDVPARRWPTSGGPSPADDVVSALATWRRSARAATG